MSARSISVRLLLLAAIWTSPSFADVNVYGDALQNNFLNFSYGTAAVNLTSTAQVHAGTYSISFSSTGFDALKLANNSQLFNTATTPLVHLWFYGSAAQCQGLDIILERNNGAGDDLLFNAPFSGYANCAAIAGSQWLEVTIDLTAAPAAYTGTYDRISFFNDGGQAFGPVYFDDITLTAPVAGNDPIFANGFEQASAAGTIVIEPNAACGGNLLAERYTWQDASGRARSATLSHNDTAQNSGHEGELCDFTYHTDAVTVRDVQELTSGGAGGFGYIVSHLIYKSAAYYAAFAGTDHDDSPLGHSFVGTFSRSVLQGRHHVILRLQLSYPRWGENPNTNVATKRYLVPVTIDWLVATGRNHPLWSVTYDLQGAVSDDGLDTHPIDGEIKADSRAPYGDMAFDGAGTAAGYGNSVGGVAWGDHYKFTTIGATPMTLNSSWTWNQPNTIPYVYLWTQAPAPDAEMGIVQSEDIGKQDAGSEFSFINWNTTSAAVGQGCPPPDNYIMPCVDYQWAYQANSDDTSLGAEGDKHLTWGTGYGFLGWSAYNSDGSLGTSVGWPRQSYSTYVVLGLHSSAATAAQVTQVENAMSSTMSASLGAVTTNGAAGVGRSDTRTFQPAGYNRVYGTWEANAAGGNATFTLNAAGSGLLNPMFIVHNHANALPASVTFDGSPLIADADYFATVDPANADHADTRLWITVNRNWIGSHTLNVQ
jgi:hypothetical protein